MSETDHSPQAEPPPPAGRPYTLEELRFLAELMDELERGDAAAHQALLRAGPEWVELYGERDDLRGRIRAALTEQTAQPAPLPEVPVFRFSGMIPAGHSTLEGPQAADTDSDEPTGILTSVTRHLPPEKAIELYRKIAPIFVYQVLARVDRSASLGDVSLLVDHLCSDRVQERLRQCEHVRDGILDEFREALNRGDIKEKLSRDVLQQVLEECGAVNDLIAMENCIRLAASKAG